MSNQTPTSAPYRYGRYLLALLAVGVLLYPLPFLILRAPHFERWSTSPYGHELEYGMTAAHVDADVLIFGDSAAYYGLDPVRMSSELGLKVFNVPNLLPSLRVNNDLALERYLAVNKPPRLIVFYLGAWDLDYTNTFYSDALYDGEEMLLRHGSADRIEAFYKKRPDQLLQFPFMFYRVNSVPSMGSLLHPQDSVPEIALTLGHKSMPPAKALAGDCAFPAARLESKLPTATARELLARYNSPASPAVIYIAPLPACKGAATMLAHDYSALGAAPPRALPPAIFVNDGYYAHPFAEQVPAITDQLVDALRPILQKQKR